MSGEKRIIHANIVACDEGLSHYAFVMCAERMLELNSSVVWTFVKWALLAARE